MLKIIPCFSAFLGVAFFIRRGETEKTSEFRDLLIFVNLVMRSCPPRPSSYPPKRNSPPTKNVLSVIHGFQKSSPGASKIREKLCPAAFSDSPLRTITDGEAIMPMIQFKKL